MKLITIEEAEVLLDKSRASLNSFACQIKKETGLLPSWYIKIGRTVYINWDELNQQNKIEQYVWNYNTDTEIGLYWILNIELGINDDKLANIFSRTSKHFNNKDSWMIFLGSTLFCLPTNNKVQKRYTMGIDFFILATKLIYKKIKEGKFNDIG